MDTAEGNCESIWKKMINKLKINLKAYLIIGDSKRWSGLMKSSVEVYPNESNDRIKASRKTNREAARTPPASRAFLGGVMKTKRETRASSHGANPGFEATTLIFVAIASPYTLHGMLVMVSEMLDTSGDKNSWHQCIARES